MSSTLAGWVVPCIILCGGAGAVARFILNTSIQRLWNHTFPLATFLINCAAALFAGIAAAAYFYATVNYPTYLLFVTGFCGGFSTFSTAINEMVGLLRGKQWWTFAWYFLGSVILPIVMVMFGWWVGSIGC